MKNLWKILLWEGSAEKLLSKESVLIFQIRGNFLRLPLQGLIQTEVRHI